MRVVGVNTAHDSSVAVYCDGEVEFFYKEERLTKIKRDKSPFAAMHEAAKFIGDKKVDVVVLCSTFDPGIDQALPSLVDGIRKIFKTNNIKELYYHHHLQHASLAFYNSGFDKAIVVVADRNGSSHPDSQSLMFESESVFVAEYPNTFDQIKKNYSIAYRSERSDKIISTLVSNETKNKPNQKTTSNSLYGITKVYETATMLIGEHVLENGKTMGLAAYGNEVDNPPKLFLKDGTPNDSLFFSSLHIDYTDKVTRSVTEENYLPYADYAYQVQKQTQEQVLNIIKWAVEKTGIKNVCLVGGYALNVVANGYYISNLPDCNFFFEPLSDDTGTSIGGAMLVYRDMTGDKNIYPLKTTFFNGYEPDLSLKNLHQSTMTMIDYDKTKAKKVAQLLVDNKKVAIFNGKAEAGPRALGNRSILFYPNLKDSKNIINRIKKREWYRPFAASVLKEDAPKYFDMMNIEDSPYMTVSFNCLKITKELFPGIVHVDDSCRVQTVDKDNPYLYDLLKEVKKLTGHGIVLNTSFNFAGSPLIDSLSEAIDFMLRSELDYIWTPKNNTIIYKKQLAFS